MQILYIYWPITPLLMIWGNVSVHVRYSHLPLVLPAHWIDNCTHREPPDSIAGCRTSLWSDQMQTNFPFHGFHGVMRLSLTQGTRLGWSSEQPVIIITHWLCSGQPASTCNFKCLVERFHLWLMSESQTKYWAHLRANMKAVRTVEVRAEVSLACWATVRVSRTTARVKKTWDDVLFISGVTQCALEHKCALIKAWINLWSTSKQAFTFVISSLQACNYRLISSCTKEQIW